MNDDDDGDNDVATVLNRRAKKVMYCNLIEKIYV